MKKYISTVKMKADRVGPVYLSLRERLHFQTRELAITAGRSGFEITQRDYEQAKRDVTGEVDLDRQNIALDARKSGPSAQLPDYHSN